ncbi:sulfatase [Engelhardtia mirabilis]|uniref:Choline-sulfatase n=1 Tax=Engelhardtia mirabilis TaxID=2528011 RepID=A0A518BKE7_9BACT|nr:Choline-sulfatase [Planctomycetes bacterium Pla133]QDV01778.1 Choline-sulfatase [Planctomycetes bacterium Pla86]
MPRFAPARPRPSLSPDGSAALAVRLGRARNLAVRLGRARNLAVRLGRARNLAVRLGRARNLAVRLGRAGALVGLGGGLIALTGCGKGAPPQTVVLISLDTTRADLLRFDDNLLAPRMTELAQRGTVFDQAISGTSWTLPSHAQMFTGQPPMLHGVQDDNVRIDPLTPTLPQLLSEAGFKTIGAYSGPYLFSEFGFGQGFDDYGCAMTGGTELEARWQQAVSRGDDINAVNQWMMADVQSHRDVSSPEVVRRAGAGAKAAGDDDLFVFAHFFDPHYDYVPPAPYDTRFDPDYEGTLDGRDFYANPRIFDAERNPLALPARDHEHLIALYAGEMAWTDDHVGQLLDQLAAQERLDQAWILITGDHGEEFYDHGSWGHRHSLYDEQLRVPLLVVPPVGSFEELPARSELQVSLSDVAPTLLEAVGLPIPEHVFGRSLLPILRGEQLPELPALASLRTRPRVMSSAAEGAVAKHVVTDCYRTPTEKLIRRFSVKQGEKIRLLSAAWYDLVDDPLEQNPVGDLSDPRLVAAWGQLEQENDKLRQRHAALTWSSDDARATSAKKMFTGQMQALGYVDEGGGDGPDLNPPWGLGPIPAVPLP